jgi:hypothetical protein
MIQNIVHPAAGAVRTVEGVLDELAGTLVGVVAVPSLQQPGVVRYHPEGFPEVVGSNVCELFEFLVRALQLRDSLVESRPIPQV